jgi:triphosphoribosyl-dephospho-CoA synthetase
MSDNNDTNVLYRSDLQTLEMLKKLSEKSFENMDNYVALCNFCKTKNISPGGSADILAVSLFFFYLK